MKVVNEKHSHQRWNHLRTVTATTLNVVFFLLCGLLVISLGVSLKSFGRIGIIGTIERKIMLNENENRRYLTRSMLQNGQIGDEAHKSLPVSNSNSHQNASREPDEDYYISFPVKNNSVKVNNVNVSQRQKSSQLISDSSSATVPTPSSPSSWSEIQDLLCPNYKPNHQLGDLIFHLARKELNVVEAGAKKKNHQRVGLFFRGSYQHMAKVCTVSKEEDTITNSTSKQASNHGIIYIRIWKCANNQIMTWLNQNLNCHSKADLDESLRLMQEEFEQGIPQQPEKPLLHERNEVNGRHSHTNAPPPCVITAIRDPISHFLSAYNEVEYQWETESSFFTSQDKERIAKSGKASYVNQQIGSRERFSTFVADMLRSPSLLAMNGAYEHLDLMSRILPELERFNVSLTAYLPTLSNLSYTWPKFVNDECINSHSTASDNHKESNLLSQPPPPPPMLVEAQHEDSGDPYGTYQAAKNVWKSQGSIARALCILHAMDYACWRDLPNGIPDLCQEVYSDNSFANELLSYSEEG